MPSASKSNDGKTRLSALLSSGLLDGAEVEFSLFVALSPWGALLEASWEIVGGDATIGNGSDRSRRRWDGLFTLFSGHGMARSTSSTFDRLDRDIASI
jgi:hypothetical protein